MRHLTWGALALIFLAGNPSVGSATDWSGFNKKINLPGILTVGAEYCAMGTCRTVERPNTRYCVTLGDPSPACQSAMHKPEDCPTRTLCHNSGGGDLDLPVFVVAESSAGSVLVRFNGQLYVTAGSLSVVVICGDQRVPLSAANPRTETAFTVCPTLRPPTPIFRPEPDNLTSRDLYFQCKKEDDRCYFYITRVYQELVAADVAAHPLPPGWRQGVTPMPGRIICGSFTAQGLGLAYWEEWGSSDQLEQLSAHEAVAEVIRANMPCKV
jgi:hypothetical protein